MRRIAKKFQALNGKSAFVSYICAGDPDMETSSNILKQLPEKGVDIIELGIPFLDPAGDGPIIENASKRAIAHGATLKKVLWMVEEFRKTDSHTPIVLMSYFNPIFTFGCEAFFKAAQAAGVDGVLIVDVTIEENADILCLADDANIDLIQLIAPTTDESRIQEIADKASGFLYLISMLGITGTKSADLEENKINLQKIRNVCDVPVVIGFGIKGPEQAGEFSQIGVDGVVIGSAFVKDIDGNFSAGKSSDQICESALTRVQAFAQAIK